METRFERGVEVAYVTERVKQIAPTDIYLGDILVAEQGQPYDALVKTRSADPTAVRKVKESMTSWLG